MMKTSSDSRVEKVVKSFGDQESEMYLRWSHGFQMNGRKRREKVRYLPWRTTHYLGSDTETVVQPYARA